MKAYDSIYNRYIKRIIDLILAVPSLLLRFRFILWLVLRLYQKMVDRYSIVHCVEGREINLFGFSSSVPWLRMRTKWVGNDSNTRSAYYKSWSFSSKNKTG